MIKDLINLDANDTAEGMFGIEPKRLDEISEKLDDLINHIADNYDSFCYLAEGENTGRTGLSAGKVLSAMLAITKTEQEELLIMFTFGFTMEQALIAVNAVLWQKHFNKSSINK